MGSSEQIDEQAQRALQRRGERLLDELKAMRDQEAAPAEVEPLDPQALLALHRRGDAWVAQLAVPRRRRRRWLGVAAALLALMVTVYTIANLRPPPEPSVAVPKQPSAPVVETPLPPFESGVVHGTDPLASAPIPEPGSAMLALLAGAVLLLRRRR